MQQNDIPDDCPIQQLFKDLRSIEMLKQEKQERAYLNYFNKIYEELKKHPFPTQPFSALNIVENFLSQHLQEYTDAQHIAIMFLILNTCMCPVEMIHYPSIETVKSLKQLKKQILEGNFLENIMNYILQIIQQGNDNVIVFQERKDKIDHLTNNLQVVRKRIEYFNRQQQLQPRQANNAQESQSENSNQLNQEEINPQQNTVNQQGLTIDQRYSSEIVGEVQENNESTEVSEIKMEKPIQLQIEEYLYERQRLSNLIGELKEKNLETEKQLQDVQSILIQFLTFINNLLTIDTTSNQHVHQLLDSTGLISAIQLIIDIATEYSFFETLKPYCTKVCASILISQQFDIYGNEIINFGKKRATEQKNAIKLKVMDADKEAKSNTQTNFMKTPQTHNNSMQVYASPSFIQHIPISSASSIGSYLIRQVQTHGFNYLKQHPYDHQITNVDFSVPLQKRFKRISKKDSVVDDYGEQVKPLGTVETPQKSEKKTMPVTEVPLTFPFLVRPQRNNEFQQKNVAALLQGDGFYMLLENFSKAPRGLILELKKNFFLQNSRLEYFARNFCQDDRAVARAYAQLMVQFGAAVLREYLAESAGKAAEAVINFVVALIRLAEAHVQEFLDLQGELRQFAYEYFHLNAAVVDFTYVVSSYIQTLLATQNDIKTQLNCKLAAKAALRYLAQQNNQIQEVDIVVQNQRDGELDQAILELASKEQFLSDNMRRIFDVLIASDVLELLKRETRDWALVREDVSGSTAKFLKILKTHFAIFKAMKAFQDDSGMVRVLRQRKVKVVERSSDIDNGFFSDQSEDIQLPQVQTAQDQSSGLESGRDEQEELIDDTDLRWAPEYLFVRRLLHGGIIQQIQTLIYALIFRSSDQNRYKHIDFCVEALRAIGGFDAGGTVVPRALAHIGSLCMMEQVLELGDLRLKKLQVFYAEACQQIKDGAQDTDHIYQFLTQVVLGEDFKYNVIFDAITYDYKRGNDMQPMNASPVQVQNRASPVQHLMPVDHLVADQFRRRTSNHVHSYQQTQNYQDDFLAQSDVSDEGQSNMHNNDMTNAISDDLSSFAPVDNIDLEVSPVDYQIINDRLVTLSLQYGRNGALQRLVQELGFRYSEQNIAQAFERQSMSRQWSQNELEYLVSNQFESIEDLASILWRTNEDVGAQLQQFWQRDKL